MWRGYFRPYIALNEKGRERGGSVEVLVSTVCNINEKGRERGGSVEGLVYTVRM